MRECRRWQTSAARGPGDLLICPSTPFEPSHSPARGRLIHDIESGYRGRCLPSRFLWDRIGEVQGAIGTSGRPAAERGPASSRTSLDEPFPRREIRLGEELLGTAPEGRPRGRDERPSETGGKGLSHGLRSSPTVRPQTPSRADLTAGTCPDPPEKPSGVRKASMALEAVPGAVPERPWIGHCRLVPIR